jgi:hypothetical protein
LGHTVTVKLHELLLPEISRALQMTVFVPSGKVLPDSGKQSETNGLHASENDALKVTFVGPLARTIMFDGQVTLGGVVSTTVTVKLAELEMPWLSVAVQATVLPPNGKVLPLGGVQVTGTGPLVLEAVTV